MIGHSSLLGFKNNGSNNMTVSDTCHRPSSPTYQFLAIFCTVVGIIALIFNTITIIVVLLSRHLRRQIRFLFLVSLSIADIGVTAFVTSFKVDMYLHSGSFCHGLWTCVFVQMTDTFFPITSITHILVLCIDRWFAVMRPYIYKKIAIRRNAKITIALIWCYSLTWTLLGLFRWDHRSLDFPHESIRAGGQTYCYSYNRNYFTFLFVVVYFIPLCAVIRLSTQIMKVARRKSIDERKRSGDVRKSIDERKRSGDVRKSIDERKRSGDVKKSIDERKRSGDVRKSIDERKRSGDVRKSIDERKRSGDVGKSIDVRNRSGDVRKSIDKRKRSGDVRKSIDERKRRFGHVRTPIGGKKSGDVRKPINKRKTSGDVRKAMDKSKRSGDVRKSIDERNRSGNDTHGKLSEGYRKVSVFIRDMGIGYKAVRTGGMIVTAFTLCWLPHFLAVMISYWASHLLLKFSISYPTTYDVVMTVVNNILPILNSCVNPFIYCLFYNDFKIALNDRVRKCFGLQRYWANQFTDEEKLSALKMKKKNVRNSCPSEVQTMNDSETLAHI